MMPGQNQLGLVCLFAGQGRYQVVAPHMGVNYIYPVLISKLGDGPRGLKIERVAERHLVPGRNDAGERAAQGTVGSDCQVNRVAPAGETSNQVGDVDLATTHLVRRANLENLHESLRRRESARDSVGSARVEDTATPLPKLDNTVLR